MFMTSNISDHEILKICLKGTLYTVKKLANIKTTWVAFTGKKNLGEQNHVHKI